MSRVPPLEEMVLSEQQKELANAIAGARSGHVRGPFAVWLRNPELADKANQFGNVLRRQGTLDRKLFELMVLTVARRWTAQYEWFAHERNALAAGLSTDVIEAIRERRVPAFESDGERMVYEIVVELDETRRLSQATFDRAVAFFGLDTLIELVAAIGFYTTVAMTINAFEAPVPGDARPLPI
jgi:4-carboxymuconolactone decarboxylase